MATNLVRSVFDECDDMTPTQKYVLVAIADFADAKGVAFPFVESIAKKTKLSKRTVTNAIKWLVENGYLLKSRRKKSNGFRSSNVYLVYPEKYKKYLTPDNENYEYFEQYIENEDICETEAKKEEEQPKKEKRVLSNNKKAIEEEFEELWSYYPRREAKKKAFMAFKRLKKKDREKVLLLKEAIAQRYENTQKQFIPLLGTFLNQERYEDEYFDEFFEEAVNENEDKYNWEYEESVKRLNQVLWGERKRTSLHEKDYELLEIMGMSLDEAIEYMELYTTEVFRDLAKEYFEEYRKRQ